MGSVVFFFFLVVAFTTVLVSKFSDMCRHPCSSYLYCCYTYIAQVSFYDDITSQLYSGRIILVQFVVAFM